MDASKVHRDPLPAATPPMESPTCKFDWRLWGWWLLATAGGSSMMITLSGLVLAATTSFAGLVEASAWLGGILAVVQFPLLAGGVAVPQWLVLRRYVPKAGYWIVATSIGLILGTVASAGILSAALLSSLRGGNLWGLRGAAQPLLLGALVGAALGFFVGAAQWVILGRAIRRGPLPDAAIRGGRAGAVWWFASTLLGWTSAGGTVAYAIAIATEQSIARSSPSDVTAASIALGHAVSVAVLVLGGIALALNTGPALVGLLKALPGRTVLLPHLLGLLVLAALWMPVALESPPWASTDVATGAGYATALQFDAAGRPHISYTDPDGNIRYATQDGDTRRVEMVDRGGTWWQTRTTLALDAAGRPHISYVSGSALRYAHFDGTSWQTQTVDSQQPVGEYNSLVLDAAGRPHISYNLQGERGSAGLKYAFWDGATWWFEPIDRGYNVGEGNSLVLDAAGRPHVSYSGCGLAYAYSDGMRWYTETVAPPYTGRYTALALDAAGRPHIGYYGYLGHPNMHVAYAYHDGTSWHIEAVAAEEEGNTQALSLALDTAGTPHITYSACPVYGGLFGGGHCSGLWYASRGVLGWRVGVVDWAGGGHASLALDPAGRTSATCTTRGAVPWGRPSASPIRRLRSPRCWARSTAV